MYLTSAKIHCRCMVVFLPFSSLPCICPFLRHILNWNKVLHKLFPIVCVLFWDFLSHLQNRIQVCILCWKWKYSMRGMNAFCTGDERFNAGNVCVEYVGSNLTYTASYQRLSNFIYLKIIATHRYSGWKTGGAITLSFSPLSTLNPQVIHACDRFLC